MAQSIRLDENLRKNFPMWLYLLPPAACLRVKGGEQHGKEE